MLQTPNAGGHSEKSEVLSFELMHRLFGAKLLQTEMEIVYLTPGWKKTDYICRIGSHLIGVSVTRAFSSRSRTEEDADNPITPIQAIQLIRKKLFGIESSTIGVVTDSLMSKEELASSSDIPSPPPLERQILHIWTDNEENVLCLRNAFQSLHPRLRSNTIVVVTVARNCAFIFK